ncbi:M15 family metallopeptidase [Caedibacter taeniospiralis]|uniref:M15 family metallopeptidase n=1 Tax=Caedibacter taeniospiralis TaxID=28907 RepID=UPI000C275030|nr:M15 family metallopeptidase [Caedibacter taeniospiralis]
MDSEFVALAGNENIFWDIKYSSDGNILGRQVNGYYSNKCIMTKVCLRALQDVQKNINRLGLSLFIWDAYRPRKAVMDFWQWSQDVNDDATQSDYYPNLAKKDLFAKGYFSKTSNHCSGSTVDLTLVDQQGQELDMGTCFDFMDPLSHPDSTHVSAQAIANRQLLREHMLSAGFEPIDTEWWHFRLIDEPFANKIFDFDIV